MVLGPVSDAEIHSAETDLGVVFPLEYVAFLRSYGAAVFGSKEIYGLPDTSSDDPPVWSSILTMTKHIRKMSDYWLDHQHLLPISSDGMDNMFYLDTEKSPATSIRVIGPGVDEVFSESMDEFIMKLHNEEFEF